MSDTSPTHDQTDLPAELRGHSPEDVHDDRIWYSQFVTEGEWFLDVEDEQCFIVTSEVTEDDPRLRLAAASRIDLTGNTPRFVPVVESHHSRTLLDIAAEMELGRLVHLPENEPLTIGESTVFRANGIVAHFDAGLVPSPSTVSFGGMRHSVPENPLEKLPKPALFIPPSKEDEIDSPLSLSPVSDPARNLQDGATARQYSAEDSALLKMRYGSRIITFWRAS